jgi:hypothetical protein
MAVTAAATLRHILGELFCVEQRYILLNRWMRCAVYSDAELVQPGERSCADAPGNDRVDLLIIDRFDGVAGAVGMVLVVVPDHRQVIRFTVNDQEQRR